MELEGKKQQVMPLPRGSKDGPEDLAKRDEEGANSCSVRARLSLALVSLMLRSP